MLKDLWHKRLNNTMRAMMIFSYVFVVVTVFGVWAIVSLQRGTLVEVAVIASLAGTIITVVTAGKWLEKKVEGKNDDNSGAAKEP